MEAQAEKMCREGLMIMQNNQTLLAKHDLSPSEKKQLVGELEKSKKLLGDGMGLLSQAKAKSDHEYDTKQYQEALITARKKLMELRD
jgi:hypothetical protein